MGQEQQPQQIPDAPDSVDLYKRGTNLYLKFLPRFLRQEMKYRNQQDPQRLEQQQGLQDQFGPTQYRQMLESFMALDPTYYQARESLGNQLMSDMPQGQFAEWAPPTESMGLTPDMAREQEQHLRASQAARGNTGGTGAGIAEAYAKGSRGLELYQQRFQNYMAGRQQQFGERQARYGNLGSWLSGPTMAQSASFVPPVSADRSMGYVNPNAGFQGQQFGLQNYQNQLAQSQLNGPQGQNPWMSSLSGAASGASAGTMINPGWGTAIGAVAGGLFGGLGSAYSDKRLKKNVKRVGTDEHGLGLYEYNYKPKFVGHIAQEVARKFPEAVTTDPASGYLKVSQEFAPVPVEA